MEGDNDSNGITASEECEWQTEDAQMRSGISRWIRGHSNPEQVAAKPNTPPRLRSGRAQRQRVKPTVVIVDSDSCDSEFHASLENSESSDSSSDYESTGATKRKSKARGRVDIDVDEDLREYEAPRPRGRLKRQPRAPARASNRKNKDKVVKSRQPRQPVAPLAWEVLQQEWDDEWTNCWEYYSETEEEPAKSVKLEQRDPPAEMIMPLLPFQKEWLAWSLKQEAGAVKGGILADEMGMGKTIQAISLIVTGRALDRSPRSKLDPRLASVASCSQACHTGHIHADDSLPKLPQVKATLVICPLVAVIQWRNEVARFTRSGSVKVLVYHGPRRSIGLRQLEEYDIILTTYSIVESEHRKHVMPPKDACEWCGRRFYPDRMTLHQKYFCGPEAHKTAKQALQEKRRPGSGKTVTEEAEVDDIEGLVDSLLDSGNKSRKGKASSAKGKGKAANVDGKGKLGKPPVAGGGRGRKRKIGEVELEDALQEATEVVRTMEKASSSEASGGNSVLHSVRWERIILDEAHSIKDRRCSTAKAVFALQSEYKWALSGTPLQNRVGELYSLVRFLGMYPYAYYFCRKCECKSLEYKFGSQAQKCDCGHTPMVHFCWWNKYIAAPIKRDGYSYQGSRSMVLLKKKVLANALLRRTKLERAADLALPPRTAFLRRDAFDSKEEDFYQALYTQSQSQFNTYVNAGTLVNNYAHIFDLLTRLRQAVDHPYLVAYSPTTCREAPIFDTVTVDAATVEGSCGVCHEPAEDSVMTACRHTFCRSCIQEYIAAAAGSTSQCPTCSVPLTVDFAGPKTVAPEVAGKGYKRSSILSRINLQQFKTSTKIDAVKEEIALMLERDVGAKAIIFSQFTSMLDLIGFSLQRSGIKFVKLDGSMTMSARDVMIESFKNDPDTKVFLMSLKAGGVALNLTVASHVFLMDPWWNPAVEQQAQDRIHRLGQFKPIRVIRFVIENTIEERILKLQEKKQLVFEGTVGGSSEALGKLTEEDLRFLFTN